MANVTITTNITMSASDENAQAIGPLSINLPNALEITNTLALSTSFAQITLPSGAGELWIFAPASNTIDILVGGANTDAGITIGTCAGDWMKCPIVGGTTTFWVKSASGTPTIRYRIM